MEKTDSSQKIKELEKTNRILLKNLERCHADRILLEEVNEKKEFLLKKVIQELRESQTALEERERKLEKTLENLQKMQLKLVESEKMSALGVLVAGIAHEINNPVSFIYGNLNPLEEYMQNLLKLIHLYQQYYPEPPQVIQTQIKNIELDFIEKDLTNLLMSMQVGTERIYNIVKSLRTFSRLDEAKLKQADIHEGIDSTLMILKNRLQANTERPEIVVIKEYGQLPLVNCYPSELNQVFMNILVNAIYALDDFFNCQSRVVSEKITNSEQLTTTHPLIRISTSVVSADKLTVDSKQEISNRQPTTDEVEIRIADNGAGMNEEVRSKQFDPFFTTKPVGKGTGMGLSISYQIVVEKHCGKLHCNSAPGQGAEFIISIPVLYFPEG